MGKLTGMGFLREQTARVPPAPKVGLSGKTVIVIGANAGLGFEASKHFAKMNPARLILACRSREKGEAALNVLQSETGYNAAELWIIDLANFSSVVEFANRFEKEGGRLDILLENAASVPGTNYEATTDGWETTLQVNCLSLSLLALRLLPQMIDTAVKYGTRPRLVVVTSEVHFWAKLEKKVLDSNGIFETLSSREYNTPKALGLRYFDTKLLNVFFYRGLNERLHDSLVITCGVNPGFCLSGIRRPLTGGAAAFSWLMDHTIARTTEEGGRQLVYASIGGVGEENKFRGAYISAMKISEASDTVLDSEGIALQNRLWGEMMDILSKVDPRVQEVANKHLRLAYRS